MNNTGENSPKTIETIISDIYDLFVNGHECSEENLNTFAESIKQGVKSRLLSYRDPQQRTLRMSNIGKKDRQLWYDVNTDAGEPLPSSDRLKFLFGDIIEALVILLAKESGHKVEDEQKEVVFEGVVGHIDCKIDGVLVDVKSTSERTFQKFKKGTLFEDDPFGYVDQLTGYCEATESKRGAFLALDKSSGDLALLEIKTPNGTLSDRIDYVREMLKSDTPPVRCYDVEPLGKSGNTKLPVGCRYCSHKFKCWSDSNNGQGLRTFLYSSGPVFLTHVSKTPEVFEVKK